jgi:uncharacterized protein YjbI with pentapeptide repeats
MSVHGPETTTAVQRGDLQAGARLQGADLSGLDLSGVDLTGADLSGANLTDTKGMRTCLRGANLHGALLDRAQFLHADLSEADLSDASGKAVGLGGCDLRKASLFGASLPNASLSQAVLAAADLRMVQLQGARLRGADLSDVDASQANLTDADMTDAIVAGTVFHGADMTRASLQGITGHASSDWVGCRATDADFTGAYLARRAVIDQNYLHEFRTQNKLHDVLYRVWWITSDCGRSYLRWACLTLLFAAMFAGFYELVDIQYAGNKTTLSSLYFSIVTLTTLGYGDVLPVSQTAQAVVMAQVVIGYIMLGGLLSIFSSKMSRRGD